MLHQVGVSFDLRHGEFYNTLLPYTSTYRENKIKHTAGLHMSWLKLDKNKGQFHHVLRFCTNQVIMRYNLHHEIQEVSREPQAQKAFSGMKNRTYLFRLSSCL